MTTNVVWALVRASTAHNPPPGAFLGPVIRTQATWLVPAAGMGDVDGHKCGMAGTNNGNPQ